MRVVFYKDKDGKISLDCMQGEEWSAVIEQDGRVVFDAPLILNFFGDYHQ